MIHLDANLLIAAIDAAHPHHPFVVWVLNTGEPAATDSVAWTEFRSKPVPLSRVRAIERMIGSRILPYTELEAALAGELYQLPGIKRSQRLDTMIAATAIMAGAELATVNDADFAPFVPHGLTLFPLPRHRSLSASAAGRSFRAPHGSETTSR